MGTTVGAGCSVGADAACKQYCGCRACTDLCYLSNYNEEGTMKRIAAIFIAVAGALSAVSVGAAETYPTKPVRMIVPYVAGGNADIQARYIAERLTDALGKQFVVDNRGGANGIIGLELAVRAPADGYTVVLVA